MNLKASRDQEHDKGSEPCCLMRTEQTHRQEAVPRGLTSEILPPLFPPAPKICTLMHGGRPYPGLPGLVNENSTPVAVVSVTGIPLALAPRKEPVPARV